MLDPAKEGGVVRRHKTGNEGREFPDKILHLAVRRLKGDMDAGRPGDERLRVEVRAAALVGVHYRLQSRVSVYGRPRRVLLLPRRGRRGVRHLPGLGRRTRFMRHSALRAGGS